MKILLLVGLSLTINAGASEVRPVDLTGTWKYEKKVDLLNGPDKSYSPEFPAIQIIGSRAAFSPTCIRPFAERDYAFSILFQNYLKGGVAEAQVVRFLESSLAFDLRGMKKYLQVEESASRCNQPIGDILVSGRQLVIPYGFSGFVSYRRLPVPTSDEKIVAGRQISQLPFHVKSYVTMCQGLIPFRKGIPQTTNKCAPVHFPYTARADDKDTLSDIIGKHEYIRFGGRGATDYDVPFSHGLHPTFVILPPWKGIFLIRVDDLEAQEGAREPMSGAYLAIKGNKVIDQLNEACSISEDYFCIDSRGNKRFQLLESGKFKPL